MHDLLDLELTCRLQVGAWSTDLGLDRSELVREQTHGLRTANIDAEYVHGAAASYVILEVHSRKFMRDRSPGVGPRPALIAAAAIIFLVVVISRLHAQADPGEVRAIWILRTTLSSQNSIETMVDAAKGAGFNALFVEVSGRADLAGTSGFNGSLSSSFDPLTEVIERAHAAGLRVHAWIDVTEISSAADLPLSRDHVVYRHPDWLMVPQALAADLVRVDLRSPEYLGRLARYQRAQSSESNGLYLSPATAGAGEYAAGVVRELVARYAVDGVHLDDARYPRADFDYSRDALAVLRRSVIETLSPPDQAKYDRQLAAEPLIYTEAFPERWRLVRAEQLTTFVARIREAIRAVRPDAIVSATVLPDPEQASAVWFQDWRGWLGRSLIDVVSPVASTADPSSFATEVASVRQITGRHPMWAGIGASRLSTTDIVASVKAARQLGAGGVILFSYDGLTGPSRGTEYLAQLGRAAFMQ
jgi:uncharacterized lipoprotein YddW (UPF0748 family)